jgi:hypothetical protein
VSLLPWIQSLGEVQLLSDTLKATNIDHSNEQEEKTIQTNAQKTIQPTAHSVDNLAKNVDSIMP